MNILILQGSPRANGNTAWMAEEYRKAAEAAGHKVTLVDVAHKKIAGCMACEYCHGKGNGAIAASSTTGASRTRASSRPKSMSRRRTRRAPKFSSSLKNCDYAFRAH